MKTLFIIKDGVKGIGNKVNEKGEQKKSTTFHLLSFNLKSNIGYFEKKGKNQWKLYTSLGAKANFSSRYHYLSTYDECINKLIELGGNINIEIVESEWARNEIEKEQNEKKLNQEIKTEFNKIVGLNNVKNEIIGLLHFAQVRKKKINLGLPVNPPTLHMVFYGNPGTGKTTFARIIAEYYFKLGLIEKNIFKEVSRTELVGDHIGHTALKTTNIFNEAMGGILFIDEAYSLYTGNKNDFGLESINTLIKLMEDNREQIVVIIAGYEIKIKKLLSSNPGFKERFSTFIHFQDYSVDELFQIAMNMFQKIEHHISRGACFKLELLIEYRFKNGYFLANGRSVRNLFDEILKCQSIRLGKQTARNKKFLSTILPEDIPDIPDN